MLPLEAFKALLAEPRTLVMGVLNVTPDSFSDGGDFLDLTAARDHVRSMIADGADMIDIGGQSTRPPGKTYGEGAAEVTEDEERRRVIPLVQALIHEFPKAIFSIDTVRSTIAREALDAGAHIINDVSAGTSDANMFAVVSQMQAPIVLMHGHGPEFTKEKIEDYVYDEVVKDISVWLRKRIDIARKAGIPLIMADCGFGFAKTPEDNIRILKEHERFSLLGVPMVLGVSRKSTIGRLLNNVPPKERINGSVGAAVYGALHGAKIIRTHDVKQTREALKVVDAIRHAS